MLDRIEIDTNSEADRLAADVTARLAAIVEASDDAIIGQTLEGIITDWNAAASQLYGYSAEEAVGKPISLLVPSGHAEQAAKILNTIRAGGRVRRWKTVRCHKNGSLLNISLTVSPILGEDGRIVGVSGIGRDITQREGMEEALRTSEERYRLLFERNVAGVYRASYPGKLLECNEAYSRMLGYSSREELCNFPMLAIWADPGDRERALQLLSERGHLLNYEVQLRRKDGSFFPALVNITLSKNESQDQQVVEGTVLDITEIRQLQQQLLHAQKMEGIGRLAGGVAHDFNNLLMIIHSYSELLLNTAMGERQRGYIEQILQASRRATDLTGQLLAFSRKQATMPKVLDLNSVVRDVAKMLPRLLGEDIRVEAALASGLDPCQADPTHLQQIIMNLAVNARDAMPHGGQLTIETANAQLGAGYAANHASVVPGPYVMLAVSDTGTGIDPAIQAHIFEPFFTTKEAGKGTGLGLSTVYGTVKQNGGYLFLYSELGRGSTFKVYLPSVRVKTDVTANKTALPNPAYPMPTRASGTILLVEDEMALRHAISEMLEVQGFLVLAASHGQDAIRTATQFAGDIHLLLTDMVMPGMNGVDLAGRVAALRPDIRILFMSGYPEHSMPQKPIGKVAGHYLQKPFSPQALWTKVGEILQ